LSPSEISHLEYIETKLKYDERQIVLAYVTDNPKIITTLRQVFLVSPMIMYPNLAEAKRGVSNILRRRSNEPYQPSIDISTYTGIDL